MTKTLYLMRHGETLFNKRNLIQGASDSPLTQAGINQAKFARKYYENNNITFDHAYSSTQERACDTLELITDMPYTRLKGIKEMNFGVYEAESQDLQRHPFPNEFYKAFGGESLDEVGERMVKTLTEIMEKEDHTKVLAVSHGGAMRNFASFFIPKDQPEMLRRVDNCCIFKFEYDGTFHLIEIINHDFSQMTEE